MVGAVTSESEGLGAFLWGVYLDSFPVGSPRVSSFLPLSDDILLNKLTRQSKSPVC